jgi:hypothetical protein
METETLIPATAPVVVEKARRATTPRRHRLEEDPPPPIRVYSIDQIEAEHPGIKGRLRRWIQRADAGDVDFAWLKFCVIRVAGSVFVDEVRFRDSLYQRTALPAAPSRREGPKRQGGAAAQPNHEPEVVAAVRRNSRVKT